MFDQVFANIVGQITDAGTNEPIPGAQVSMHPYLIRTTADNKGRYALPFMPLGNYLLNFSAPQYLSRTYEAAVEDGGNYVLNAALLHGQCNVEPDEIIAELNPGESREFAIETTNNGNGPLTYQVRKHRLGEIRDPWNLIWSLDASDLTHDSRIEGVVFADDRYFVSGGGNEVNQIYVLDRFGAQVDMFQQPGESRYGIQDMAWDGRLLWGLGSDSIYGITLEGELEAAFAGPARMHTIQAITWDQDRSCLWLTSITSREIYQFSRNGELLGIIDQFNLKIFGLAYWPDDPDGYPLYALTNPDVNNQDLVCVYKIDPDREDTMWVSELHHPDGGSPRGCEATNELDVYNWVFLAVANNPDADRLDVWQMDWNSSWMQIEPSEGVIAAGESQNYILTLDALNFPDRMNLTADLIWHHNGFGGPDTVSVLMVVHDVGVNQKDENKPAESNLQGLYPNPFNDRAIIKFGVDHSARTTLKAYNVTGQAMATIFDGIPTAGDHQSVWDAGNLPSGVYFIRLESAGKVRTARTVLLR